MLKNYCATTLANNYIFENVFTCILSTRKKNYLVNFVNLHKNQITNVDIAQTQKYTFKSSFNNALVFTSVHKH